VPFDASEREAKASVWGGGKLGYANGLSTYAGATERTCASKMSAVVSGGL